MPLSVPVALTLKPPRCLLAVPPTTPPKSTAPDPERTVRFLPALAAELSTVLVKVTLPLLLLEFVSIVMPAPDAVSYTHLTLPTTVFV